MGLRIGDQELGSRLLIGSARYVSADAMLASIRASRAEVVTVSLRRQNPAGRSGQSFWDLLRGLNCRVLPNTAGCRTAREAITVAEMAREIFETAWIKLELIGDEYTLQPDPIALVEAARELIAQGFVVLPYCTEDLVIAQRLVEAGCRVIMPWASPIGSGQGVLNPYLLRTLRARLPDITLIVDAGLRAPSEAAAVMELGFDGVLVNSAIALADDPVAMARAFAGAVEAGRTAWQAGLMPRRETASPSTPVPGTPFWHVESSPFPG
jgi:thiazole synthase